MKPFFSIVMPVFGVEEYILKSSESIKAQRYTNWELIIVDDGSPDRSIEIATAFWADDPRVRIVRHSRNRGLSQARNTGLMLAEGQYVWFPDPDDTYDPELLEDIKNALNKSHASVVMFGHTEEWYKSNGGFSHRRSVCEESDETLTRKQLRSLALHFEETTAYGYAWNKVYELQYLRANQLEFNEVDYIEDIEFNVRVFQNLNSLAVIARPYYHYAKRPAVSLTGKYNSNFFALHVARIRLLYDQLYEWEGLVNEEALGKLGLFLCRYIVATLRMNCYDGSGMTHRDRVDWCKRLYDDGFVASLVYAAESPRDFVLRVCVEALKKRRIRSLIFIGRVVYVVERYFYPVMSKLKDNR